MIKDGCVICGDPVGSRASWLVCSDCHKKHFVCSFCSKAIEDGELKLAPAVVFRRGSDVN